jgi:hypothetical protein
MWVIELITPPGLVELSLGQSHVTHGDGLCFRHGSREAKKPLATARCEQM